MAIRIDAEGDGLHRTSSLPSSTNSTVALWCYLVSHRTGADTGLIELSDRTRADGWSSAWRGVHWHNFYNYNTSRSGSNVSFAAAARPANGDWFYVALVNSGTSGNAQIAYSITLAGTVYTAIISDSASFTTASVNLGTSTWGDWNNVRIAHAKIWDAALTQDELLQEMWSIAPRRTANLHLWTPLFSHTDIADYSGNGRNWTAGGTLTTEDGPPVSWGSPVWVVPWVEAAGGATYTGSGSVSLPAFTASGTGAYSAAVPVYTGSGSVSLSALTAAGTGEYVAPSVVLDVSIVDSEHISSSGAPTTARLTAPAGKTTDDFQAGRIQDDENPADAIDLAAGAYTEIEWSLAIGNALNVDDLLQFRITVGGVALDAYSQTPQVEITASGDETIVVVDTGSVADALVQLGVAFGLIDSGAGVETSGGFAATFAGDTGEVSDTVLQRALLALADTSGVFVDLMVASIQALVADTISSLTELTGANIGLSVQDSGETSDGALASIVLSVPDSVVGGDDILSSVIATISSFGALSDSIANVFIDSNVSDSGNALEGLITSATINVSDSGDVADLLVLFAEAIKSILDSGQFSDEVEAPVISVFVNDSGITVTTLGVSVAMLLSDSMSSSDLIVLFTEAIKSVLDSGSFLDNVESPTITLAVSESGITATTAGVSIFLAVNDVISSVDLISLLVLAMKQVSDVGVLNDATVIPQVLLSVSENSSGGESLIASVYALSTDSAIVVDQQAPLVSLQILEFGSSSEVLSLIQSFLVSIVESPTMTESLGVLLSPIFISDVGSYADNDNIDVVMSIGDLGSFSDSWAALAALSVIDFAGSTDTVSSVSVSIPVSDFGQGVDVMTQLYALLTVLDAMGGYDGAVSFDTEIKIVKMSISILSRQLRSSLAQRAIEYSILQNRL